MNPKLHWKRH